MRLTGGVPLVVWGAGGLPPFLPTCPWCWKLSAGVVHWALECTALQDLRGEAQAAAAEGTLTEDWR